MTPPEAGPAPCPAHQDLSDRMARIETKMEGLLFALAPIYLGLVAVIVEKLTKG